jgi:uncharacterized protein (UPF0335 family)
MARTIDNSEDIIDSRDVIERIEELEGERESLQQDVEDAEAAVIEADGIDSEDAEAAEATAREALADWDNSEEAGELAALKALAEEGEGYSDWEHGAQLIRDSYFETYAMELADEIGATSDNDAWPLNCIDWEKAARELRMDYSSIDFDGETYWVR